MACNTQRVLGCIWIGVAGICTCAVGAPPADSFMASSDSGVSTRGLVAFAPTPEAVRAHYGELISGIDSAVGEMDVVELRNACVGYSYWHSTMIRDRKKGEAVVEWIGHKLWELPADNGKQGCIDQFVNDVQRLMDAGKISMLAGIRAAQESVFDYSVLPNVKLDSLMAMLRRNADVKDPEAERCVAGAVEEVGRVWLREHMDQKEELFTFFKEHFPKHCLVSTADALFFPIGMGPIGTPISRKEYDEMGTLPVSRLESYVAMATGGDRCVDERPSWALTRMVDRFESEPDEVRRAIVSMIHGGYTSQVCGEIVRRLTSKDPNGRTPDVSSLILPCVKEYEKMLMDRNEPRLELVFRSLNTFCSQVKQEDWKAEPRVVEEVRKEMAATLVKAEIEWQLRVDNRDIAISGNSPVTVIVSFSAKEYEPAMRAMIKDAARVLLADEKAYSMLSEGSARKVKAKLERLLTLP